jgi:hypothetical protein
MGERADILKIVDDTAVLWATAGIVSQKKKQKNKLKTLLKSETASTWFKPLTFPCFSHLLFYSRLLLEVSSDADATFVKYYLQKIV